MALRFLALIVLAVLGLFVVGGIAALSRDRTRPLGYALLLLPVAGILLLTFRTFGLAFLAGATRVSWAVLGMPLAAVVVVIGIAALMSLLANSRTRPIGYALLAVPLVLAGLVAVWSYQIRSEFEGFPAIQATAAAKLPSGNNRLLAPSPATGKSPVAGDRANIPAESPVAGDRANIPADGETTKSIVRALTAAFAQTLSELKRIPAEKAEGEKAPKKTADVNPADKNAVEKSPQAKTSESGNGITELADADRINQMVEVISGAVEQELPADVKVDQFTALRALGKLLGRLIVSEQQEEQAAAEDAKSRPSPADDTSAPGRPDWVDAQPQRIGDAYQVVVVAGPFTTRLECDQDMPEQLKRAVGEYAELYLGNEKARQVWLPPDFLREHVVKDQWEETFRSSVGPMVRVHARLLFDGRANSELKECLRRVIVEERLVIAGCGLAAVLVLLAGCFGALKFDNATGGRYRWRMFFILFFTTVFMTAIVGTHPLRTTRPMAAPDRPIEILDTNTPVSHDVERISDVREMPAAQARSASPLKLQKDFLSFGIIAVVSLLCLNTGLLAFKKTRKAGLILLSAEVVVVLGALVLVA